MRVDVSDLTQTDRVSTTARGRGGRGGVRTTGGRPIRFANAGTGQGGFIVANPVRRHAGRGGRYSCISSGSSSLPHHTRVFVLPRAPTHFQM